MTTPSTPDLLRTLAGHGGRREVVAVWRLAATATVRTPVHPGAGDSAASDAYPVDLAVVRSCDERPMVPGTTLRGLFRHHLTDRLAAFDKAEPAAVRTVFGDAADDGHQGRVCVLDAAVDCTAVGLAVRNRINAATGAADRGALFDMELLPVGATFPVRIEVTVQAGDDEQALLGAVVAAAAGLDDELGIRLGRATGRGYGRLRTGKWHAMRWSLTDTAGASVWDERDPAGPFLDDDAPAGATPAAAVVAALGEGVPSLSAVADRRRYAVLDLPLNLPHGLDDQDDLGDVGGTRQRPGTSVAGPMVAELRRALRAIADLNGDAVAARQRADDVLRRTFGGDADDLLPARCRVEFATVTAGGAVNRPRVSLDQHSAAIRHLFHDTVLTDVTLHTRLVVREPAPEHLAVLALLVQAAHAGLLGFGAHTSVGYGGARLAPPATLTLVTPDGKGLTRRVIQLDPTDTDPGEEITGWLKALDACLKVAPCLEVAR